MTLTHYIGGKLTGLTVDFPPSLNYPENTTFINTETFKEFILVAGVWEQIAQIPFNPADLDNLYTWYDASDNSTITEVANRVSQWDDKSGNLRNLVQATGGSQPLLTLADRNGLDVIDFATSRFMTASFPTINLPFTIYMVAVAPTNGGGDQHFYDATTSLGAGGYKSGTNDRFILLGNGATNIEFTKAGFAGNWNYMSHVWAVSPNGQYRMNGVDEATGTALSSATLDGLVVEARGSLAQFGDTKVAEIVIQSQLGSAEDITNMEAYMSAKWGF